MLSLASDPIPNIRFNVAKALASMTPALNQAGLQKVALEQIKPVLLKLKDDPDMDVKFFAQQALLV